VPAAMYQNDTTLTPDEQKIVDDYLFPQLITKNANMIRMSSGIRITDRAYLDLFAFSKGDVAEIKRKAIELRTRLKDWGKPLEGGHVFFLRASKESLKERLARRGTKKADRGKIRFDAKALIQQEKELMKIYKPPPNSVIDTTDSTAGETARSIARTILLEKYDPFDFAARLEEVIKMSGEL
jgi:RNase adaptor protein for sRNA GlmZ degradation